MIKPYQALLVGTTYQGDAYLRSFGRLLHACLLARDGWLSPCDLLRVSPLPGL